MKLYHWMTDFSGISSRTLGSPQRVYARWLAALRAEDLDRLLELYADDAILLGDLAAGAKTGAEQIRAYFRDLVHRRRFDITPREVRFRDFGADVVTATGSYAIQFGGGRHPDQVEHVLENFTMVFLRDHRTSEWLITNHHASSSPDLDLAVARRDSGAGLVVISSEAIQ